MSTARPLTSRCCRCRRRRGETESDRPTTMGRTPCCDSKGIKKGPWAPEEDKLLVDYVQANGPGNWRMLPKLAGTCSVCSSIEPARPLGACVTWPAGRLHWLVVSGAIWVICRARLHCRAEPVWQELPAAVDQLPAPGHQARALHPRGAQFHPPAPRHSRQQVSLKSQPIHT